MGTTMPSIFLSHSSRDKFFVRELAERIETAGVRVWLDEAEIKIGDSLTDKIAQAIERADFVGAVLSNASIHSAWVQKELQLALQQEIRGRRVVVLPILVEPVDIPPFLRDKLYADFSSTDPKEYDKNIKKLLRALGVDDAKIPAPVDDTRPSGDLLAPIPPSAARRLSEFIDVQLGDLDEQLTHRPDASRGLFHVYFRLSEQPPAEWTEIFIAERRFPRHSMWRRAWVQGPHVVIYCGLDEIEQYHHRDLTDDTANANSKFREYLMREAQTEARRSAGENADFDMIRALKRKLGE